jgi:hypothetical protein
MSENTQPRSAVPALLNFFYPVRKRAVAGMFARLVRVLHFTTILAGAAALLVVALAFAGMPIAYYLTCMAAALSIPLAGRALRYIAIGE